MSVDQAAGSPYEVRVVRQDGETVVLRNEAGKTVAIHPSVLRDNELVVAEGRVTLPQSVYEHYYGSLRREAAARREALEVELLERSVDLLRTYEDVILSSPEAAGFSSTAWQFGGIPAGRVGCLSLGVLLALWHDPRFRRTCPTCASSFADPCRSRECSLGRMMRAIDAVGRQREGVWVRR